MRKVLVYRARLPEGAVRVISVSVRTAQSAAGLGGGRLRTPCRVMLRYATAGGQVRRHRGELWTALAPGAVVRAAACQVEGGEALVSLRPVRARGAPSQPGAAVADRFDLPFSLQAWGVTALTGARVWLRLACRARPGALALRGTLRVLLETSGGLLRLRMPFVRLLAVPDVDDTLRWRASWRTRGLRAHVGPGGQISGNLRLTVRCEGRPPAPIAPATVEQQSPAVLKSIREVTGQITGLTAEPAGPGCAIVRGAVELDIYGVDATGASRWAGRAIPFAELVAAADGDRLEATAGIERLSHGPGGVQVSLVLGVMAFRTETVRLDGGEYRAERIVGTAETTVLLLTGTPVGPAPGDARGEQPLRPVPAGGWARVPVLPSTPGEEDGNGIRLHLPLPAPARAVAGLQITDAGHVEALVKTDLGLLHVCGQSSEQLTNVVAATAYPIMHGDGWQLRVIIMQEGFGHKTS